jgi:hypothetical protein
MRFGPKGRHSKAQGNVLGTRPIGERQALKGRNRVSDEVSPFQGFRFPGKRHPRAALWAIEFQPFGPKRNHHYESTSTPINRATIL